MSRKQRKPISRHCAKCGNWYQRCNRVHLWDMQNPGHRAGWHLQDDAYCTNCTPVKTVQSILVVASTAVGKPSHLKLVKTQIKKRA